MNSPVEVTTADRVLFIRLFAIPSSRLAEVRDGKCDHLDEMQAIAAHRANAAADAVRGRG